MEFAQSIECFVLDYKEPHNEDNSEWEVIGEIVNLKNT